MGSLIEVIRVRVDCKCKKWTRGGHKLDEVVGIRGRLERVGDNMVRLDGLVGYRVRLAKVVDIMVK